MSFESFVDTVLRKQLYFVHPSVFEDPMEFQYLQRMCVTEPKNHLDILYRFTMIQRFYVQSWTSLPESDAMWRIYNYNDFAVRIEIDRESIELLDDVKAVDVIYTDEPDEHIVKYTQSGLIQDYKSVAIKRTVFEHEKEVRLVKHIRWENEQDAYENTLLMGATIFDNKMFKEKWMEMYSELTTENLVSEFDRKIDRFNIGIKKESIKIDYSHIDDFIKTVMVSPFAPDWYVETVRKFCEINNIVFVGKSKLYDLEFLFDF